MNDERGVQLKAFSFEGKGEEFFKIWIVNVLLTILTLGIYSAWAKVRTQRYFYGNTYLDDANFEYHATPLQILKGRLIAVGALIIYIMLSNLFPVAGLVFLMIIMLASPWAIWSALRFNAKVSSYRQVKFAFAGELKKAYKYLLVVPAVPVLSLFALAGVGYWMDAPEEAVNILFAVGAMSVYLMVPYVQALFKHYQINNSRYGQGEFQAEIKPSFYYLTYLKLFGLSLVAYFVIAGIFFATIAGGAGMQALSTADAESMPMAMLMAGPLMMLPFILIIAIGIWTKAYLQARLRNYTLGRTSLDEDISFQSSVSTWKLFSIQITNLLLMMFTFGFAYPWTKVRLARYSAESTAVQMPANISQYASEQQKKTSALGEEMGEAFDVDADLGFSL